MKVIAWTHSRGLMFRFLNVRRLRPPSRSFASTKSQPTFARFSPWSDEFAGTQSTRIILQSITYAVIMVGATELVDSYFFVRDTCFCLFMNLIQRATAEAADPTLRFTVCISSRIIPSHQGAARYISSTRRCRHRSNCPSGVRFVREFLSSCLSAFCHCMSFISVTNS
jgi:hypothetical protein